MIVSENSITTQISHLNASTIYFYLTSLNIQPVVEGTFLSGIITYQALRIIKIYCSNFSIHAVLVLLLNERNHTVLAVAK